jgi:hypothetical protein
VVEHHAAPHIPVLAGAHGFIETTEARTSVFTSTPVRT